MISIKRLAILGGTFNPPHIGHLLLAENAAYELGVDKIIFMTAGTPPHKAYVESADGRMRYEMVKLITKDNALFSASEAEVFSDKPCYTAVTLSRLSDRFKDAEIYFIIGFDSLVDIETWYRPDVIFSKAKIAVAMRGGRATDKFCDLKKYYEEKYNADIVKITMPKVDISSSDIRRRVKCGMPIRYMTTKEVEKYIAENNLYVGGDSLSK